MESNFALFFIAAEGFRNKLVNQTVTLCPFMGKSYDKVSAVCDCAFEDTCRYIPVPIAAPDGTFQALYSSLVGDFIKSFIALDGLP